MNLIHQMKGNVHNKLHWTYLKSYTNVKTAKKLISLSIIKMYQNLWMLLKDIKCGLIFNLKAMKSSRLIPINNDDKFSFLIENSVFLTLIIFNYCQDSLITCSLNIQLTSCIKFLLSSFAVLYFLSSSRNKNIN